MPPILEFCLTLLGPDCTMNTPLCDSERRSYAFFHCVASLRFSWFLLLYCTLANLVRSSCQSFRGVGVGGISANNLFPTGKFYCRSSCRASSGIGLQRNLVDGELWPCHGRHRCTEQNCAVN
ncbi:hypothetical protein B484DRAFT_55238 [Ochromonadaceae sp. CCMP2298]|nr:hypothetical protein B484DRAFT_55238 [Ochromonadaceae sp. CCMP2298]